MPREVEIEMMGDPALTGHPRGTKLLRYSVDADEICAKIDASGTALARITNEHPPPRSWLLDKYGDVPVGVMSSNQVKQSASERQSEQEYLKSQVAALDRKHEEEAEQRRIKDAIAQKRKETAHE